MTRAAILVVIAALIGAGPAAADRGRRRHPRAHPVRASKPAPAPADSVDTRAAALREAGLERYLARDFELAAADLMEAYRLDGRETTLFDWAEAVRATGDLDLAVRLYQRLRARTTDPALTDKATRGLAACSPPPPALPAPMRARAPLAPPPRPAPSPSHAGSYALIGAGLVTGLVGLGTYVSGDRGAPPGSTHDVVTAARSDGDWRRVIGASVAAGGAVIALVGVLRYRHDERRERLAITPIGGADRIGVAMSGAF